MEPKIFLSDQEILDGLTRRDSQVIKYVYREFYPSISYLIKTNDGIEEDAEDIFQESLYIILKKIENEGINLSSSFLTYLYSVSKNLWIQRLKRKRILEQNNYELGRLLSSHLSSNQTTFDEEKYEIFIKQFENLSEDCKKLLRLFIGKLSLKEISEEMGYKSEFYVKTKKYLCKEALKKMIELDSNFSENIQSTN